MMAHGMLIVRHHRFGLASDERHPLGVGLAREVADGRGIRRAGAAQLQPVAHASSCSISRTISGAWGFTAEGQAPARLPSGAIRYLWKFQRGTPASPSSASIQR